MSTRTGGELIVASLIAQGATHAFGVPGESYLPFLDALHDTPDRLRFVICRHEGGAAYMAEAYGKLTGRPGVALVTRVRLLPALSPSFWMGATSAVALCSAVALLLLCGLQT